MNSRLIIKRVGIAIMAIISCLVFSSCLATEVEHPDYFGFDTSEFTIVVEENKHGGFHGDGTYNLILDCSENVEKSKDIVKDWKPLPLSESLQVVMYGDESYTGLVEDINWPEIKNGVYKFVDRHSESVDESDDTDLMNRYSYNFTVAIYDFDTNILYYYEIDT